MSVLTLRDPLITVGRMRVLPRADGRWILYSEALPVFHRTVQNRTFATTDEAVAFAQSLLKETP